MLELNENSINILGNPLMSALDMTIIEMSRPSMSQMILGHQVLYLPEDHPLLQMVDHLMGSSRVWGWVIASSDLLFLYQLKLTVPLDEADCSALVNTLMSNRVDTPGEERVSHGGCRNLQVA